MEETIHERRRRLARERKRRERARRSPSKVAAARAADAQAKEEKRKRDREINAYKKFILQQNPDGLSNLDDDSWITGTATASSESFLMHDDTFPSKLPKKIPYKKRRRTAAKSAKSGENHDLQLKKMVVPNHQHFVMSNLSSLWKNKKLCDAGIGNGKSTIRVHKVVLSAVCPKLLSVFSTDISSQKFLQVNFPEEVSKEALNAFAEYMYNGILDLDRDILKQLQIIAKRLDMKEFEQLCDMYLPNDLPQPTDTSASTPIPPMTSSSASAVSASIQSAPSFTTQVIEVKQEISEIELDQVKKDTAAAFGQESDVTSVDPNKSGNDACIVICPSTETGPGNNKDGHLNSSSSHQVFTSSTSSSSLAAAAAAAASTSISSFPASSTDFSIPFSQSTDVKSTRLKANPSYETPLASDLSSVSCMGETACSQSSDMNENSSKPLISTSSLQLLSTRTVESVAEMLDPNS